MPLSRFRMSFPYFTIYALAAAVLASCGGGGGGGGRQVPPPPAPPPPANVSLSSLSTSIGTLTPPFSPGTLTYTLAVPDGTTELTVTGDVQDAAATLAVNGQSTTAGVASAPIPVPYGNSVVSIAVANGSASGTTTIDVTRSDMSRAIATIDFPLPGLTDAAAITVSGTASDADSGVVSVTVNGVVATSTDGFATWTAAPVPLMPGANVLGVATQNGGLVADPNAAEVTVDRETLLIDPREMEFDNGRVLIADADRAALIAVDLVTGDVTRVDSSGPELDSPFVLAVDSVTNRAWVGDDVLDAIVEIDTASGVRTVFSVAGTGAGPELIEYYGMSLDAANDRLLTTGLAARPALVGVDLASGDRNVLTEDLSALNSGQTIPRDLELDATNNRVLINELLTDAVLGVDLDGVISTSPITADTRGMGPELEAPLGLALDGARVLVADSILDAVVDVTIATGDRRILSDPNTGNGPDLDGPTSIVVDVANARALVADTILDAVVSVDLATGDRVIVGQTSLGSGVAMFAPVDLTIDATGNRAFAFEEFRREIIAVDLTTRVRSVVVDSSFGAAEISGLSYDDAGNRLFFLTRNPGTVSVADFGAGTTQVFSGSGIVGAGPDIPFPSDSTLDAAQSRLLVTSFVQNEHAVFSVDLTSGDRSVFSLTGQAGAGPRFAELRGIALDTGNNRALVTDINLDAVLSVDLVSGDRAVLSDSTIGAGPVLITPTRIVVDEDANRALVLDTSLDAVVAVDLDSGNRTIVSSRSIGGGPISSVADIAFDPAAGRLTAVDSALSGVLAIDVDSGDRIILSK